MDLLFLVIIVRSADTGPTGHKPLPLAMQPPLIFNGIWESAKSFCKSINITYVVGWRGGTCTLIHHVKGLA